MDRFAPYVFPGAKVARNDRRIDPRVACPSSQRNPAALSPTGDHDRPIRNGFLEQVDGRHVLMDMIAQQMPAQYKGGSVEVFLIGHHSPAEPSFAVPTGNLRDNDQPPCSGQGKPVGTRAGSYPAEILGHLRCVGDKHRSETDLLGNQQQSACFPSFEDRPTHALDS